MYDKTLQYRYNFFKRALPEADEDTLPSLDYLIAMACMEFGASVSSVE